MWGCILCCIEMWRQIRSWQRRYRHPSKLFRCTSCLLALVEFHRVDNLVAATLRGRRVGDIDIDIDIDMPLCLCLCQQPTATPPPVLLLLLLLVPLVSYRYQSIPIRRRYHWNNCCEIIVLRTMEEEQQMECLMMMMMMMMMMMNMVDAIG